MPMRFRLTELAIRRCRSAFDITRSGCMTGSIGMQCLVSRLLGNESDMLRKLLWTGIYASLAAVATMAARRVASRVYRIATGEEPPTKK